MRLEGIHHITAITGDARRNLDFYTRVLGLRLVKKTVNQDVPSTYHLFYGEEGGEPGASLTFFEYVIGNGFRPSFHADKIGLVIAAFALVALLAPLAPSIRGGRLSILTTLEKR